jgi:hypothetical protein
MRALWVPLALFAGVGLGVGPFVALGQRGVSPPGPPSVASAPGSPGAGPSASTAAVASASAASTAEAIASATGFPVATSASASAGAVERFDTHVRCALESKRGPVNGYAKVLPGEASIFRRIHARTRGS